jgi:hypothetical protein
MININVPEPPFVGDPHVHQRYRSTEFGSFANFHLLLLIHTVNAYDRNSLKYQQEAIWR